MQETMIKLRLNMLNVTDLTLFFNQIIFDFLKLLSFLSFYDIIDFKE